MEKARQILDGLGGADNILDIEPCITRLRTEVRDPSLVDDAVSPIDGTLLKLHPHAFVVVGPGERGVLVHLGIDTVQLEGRGFTLLAEEGATVRAGQALVRWDPAAVRDSGRSPVCPVVALEASADALSDLVDAGEVAAGAPVFTWT